MAVLTDPTGRLSFVLAALLCLAPSSSTTAPAVADVRGTLRVGGQPAPSAVVWLDASHRQTPVRNPAGQKPVVLDQRNLDFFPHVLVVQVGTTVEFPNDDRVFHNVFSFHNGKRFDLGLYPVGAVKRVTFDETGLSRIFCNIHPNMAAYVMVVDSPYFSGADPQGRFVIPSVSPGSYSYHAWRPGGPTLTGSDDVPQAQSLDIDWP
jgi:plastocyanin